MKPSEIKVGKIYANRGAGRTRRVVLGIGYEYRPGCYWGAGSAPDEPGVLYEQYSGRDSERHPKRNIRYLRSFASWAGKDCGYVNREQAV